MRVLIAAIACAAMLAGGAWAQLPPDAVMLDKVKIPETQKSHELDPVTLEAADPALGTFEHDGVTYGLSDAGSKDTFMSDPAKYADAHDRQRWENNFSDAMSIIWCPVTDEISPGGNTIWENIGLKWESCCQFCDDTVSDADFPPALERLKKRAGMSYDAYGGAVYTEGASSPVEGAINLGGPPMPTATSNSERSGTKDVDTTPAWLKGADLQPNWAGGVGLIFENRCQECHRPGGAAPMPFMTVGQVRKWSAKMKEVLEQRTMPPWPAGNTHSYSNSKYLTDAEMTALIDWIASGYAPGEGQYEPTTNWSGEWAIGEPDHVFELGEFIVPEDSAEMVREFELATDFDEDKYIVATEVKPTDTFLIMTIDAGPLGQYHTGNGVTMLPEGMAYKLPKGESVTVRVFYTKEAGWEEYDDMSQIGVKFGDAGSVDHELLTDRMGNDDFTIAAGADSVEIDSSFTFDADGTIVGLNPVIRQRGKKIVVTASAPNGDSQELLNISYWDPAWHFTYMLPEPLEVPSGTTVTMTATFDNSDMNARNPDPSAEVGAGPNGELVEGWLTYTAN